MYELYLTSGTKSAMAFRKHRSQVHPGLQLGRIYQIDIGMSLSEFRGIT